MSGFWGLAIEKNQNPQKRLGVFLNSLNSIQIFTDIQVMKPKVDFWSVVNFKNASGFWGLAIEKSQNPQKRLGVFLNSLNLIQIPTDIQV